MADIQTMNAEVKVNCYCGEKADQHEKYWNIYAEGDKQDEDLKKNLILDLSLFPAGTKVTITEPACPKCGEVFANCIVRNGPNPCDFDWKNWVEEQYS